MKWVWKGMPFVIIGAMAGGVLLAGVILGTLLVLDKKKPATTIKQ